MVGASVTEYLHPMRKIGFRGKLLDYRHLQCAFENMGPLQYEYILMPCGSVSLRTTMFRKVQVFT